MTGERRPAPTLTALMDWLEGRLPDAQAAEIAARVAAGDESVTSDLCWLRGFLEVAAEVPLQRPPPLVRQSLTHHFTAWQQARTLTRGRRRIVTTSLLFDSRRDLPLALTRSTVAMTEAIHLGYTSDPADLVVDVTPTSASRVRLDGQVLPLDPTCATAFEAVVEGPGFRVRSVDGDEEGRFVLDDVPVAARWLTVANADLELQVRLALEPWTEDPGIEDPGS